MCIDGVVCSYTSPLCNNFPYFFDLIYVIRRTLEKLCCRWKNSLVKIQYSSGVPTSRHSQRDSSTVRHSRRNRIRLRRSVEKEIFNSILRSYDTHNIAMNHESNALLLIIIKKNINSISRSNCIRPTSIGSSHTYT